ncbi:hypothetical protein [Alistipes timonensis]
MIVCSLCGGTDVKCVVVVDPNTKEFIEFGYNAFSDGKCEYCGNVPLTDPGEVQADIDRLWAEHMDKHGEAPRYAYCCIARLNFEGAERRFIHIGESQYPEPLGKVFAACTDLQAFKALTVPDLESGREFTVISIEAFSMKLP